MLLKNQDFKWGNGRKKSQPTWAVFMFLTQATLGLQLCKIPFAILTGFR
jgi:hypothetical protein